MPKIATLFSSPELLPEKAGDNVHRRGSISYSTPTTISVKYDVTEPILGASYDPTYDSSTTPTCLARTYRYVDIGNPEIYVELRWTDPNGFYNYDVPFAKVYGTFDGNTGSVTLTPKTLIEEYAASLNPNASGAEGWLVDRLETDPDALKKYTYINLRASCVVWGRDFDPLEEMYDLHGGWHEAGDIDANLLPDTADVCLWSATPAFDLSTLSTTFPPTEVQLTQSNAAPNQTVWLGWSGARAGEGNEIIGYEVYRATSYDGEYALLTTISSTETSGQVAVVAPTTNGAAYYYKVVTLGSVDGYYSAKSAVYATLLCSYSMTQAPTTVTIDGATNVEPGAPLTVRWSGASGGENNPISGYSICYSDTVDGAPKGLIIGQARLDNGTFDTFGSEDSFTAPTENGVTYYFRVMTHGTLEGTNSDWSEAYAAVTCTYSSTNAPTKVTADGAKSVYVAPGSTVQLDWSGAVAGVNNEITGYNILRDGEAYVTGLDVSVMSYEVFAPGTTGNACQYAVVTRGVHADSSPSAAVTVYSYTDPTAPTTVGVSTSESYVGGRVELSWSGATPGGFNDIVGYKVYRADTVNGTQTLVATIASTDAAASCFVDAPNTPGATYYFRVVTVGSYSESASSDYVTVTSSGDAGADSEITVIVKPKVVPKRRMILGDYDTARDGQWTLTGWSFEEPEVQTSYVTIPWHSLGGLDMSTALTNGDPRYNRRTLTATFECSEGTREDRNRIISKMVNKLHGQRLDIVLPDDPARYIVGRVSVLSVYSDMAHASVEITANCEPWRYNKTETNIELLVTENPRTDVLCNNGRKVLVPELTVSGYNARVSLTSGNLSWTLTPGKYRLPDLVLPSGSTVLAYRGSGTVVITYREAIL